MAEPARKRARLLAGRLVALALSGCASAPPREVTQAELMRAALGPGAEPGPQYLDQRYRGYARPTRAAGRGMVYARHTGRDFRAPPGTEARALAPGTVAALLGSPRIPASRAVVVAGEDGVYWVYGHLSPEVRPGQAVERGQTVGRVADPEGAFRPHLHVTAITVPFPTRDAEVNRAIGWGRAYGQTAEEAEANALRFTDDPLEAYGCSLQGSCWLARIARWWAANVGG